jgi:hypothetical protein
MKKSKEPRRSAKKPEEVTSLFWSVRALSRTGSDSWENSVK